MTPWLNDFLMIFLAGLLVLINGFFVAAEFALVKIRESRMNEMVKARGPFGSTASWLADDPRKYFTAENLCGLRPQRR